MYQCPLWDIPYNCGRGMLVMLRPFLFAFLEQVFRDCVSYELGYVRSLVCCDFLQVFPLSWCQTDADGWIPSDCHGITPWGVLYSLCRALSTPVIPKRVKFGRTRKPGPRERVVLPGARSVLGLTPSPLRAVTPLAAGPCAVAVAGSLRGGRRARVASGSCRGPRNP